MAYDRTKHISIYKRILQKMQHKADASHQAICKVDPAENALHKCEPRLLQKNAMHTCWSCAVWEAWIPAAQGDAIETLICARPQCLYVSSGLITNHTSIANKDSTALLGARPEKQLSRIAKCFCCMIPETFHSLAVGQCTKREKLQVHKA